MKHFLNSELLAPNVMTVPVDEQIVREFADYQRLTGEFATIRPSGSWASDIAWISAADEPTFELFQSAFDRMQIGAHAAPYLDLERDVRLYAGFLVVRSRSAASHFHVDWSGANNEAFTLLTPVSGNAEEFGLEYQRLDGTVGEYRYRAGEAIVFGDNFTHSTKVGSSADPVVLLCFTFGTDKMVHWDRIKRTVGTQTVQLRRPDGRMVPGAGVGAR